MQRGELYLAPFLYADLGNAKRRPVCVVSDRTFNEGPDLIVAMVTSSQARRSSPGLGDVPLADWRSAGLLAASTVRAGRLQTIEARLLEQRLGVLAATDLEKVDEALRTVLGIG